MGIDLLVVGLDGLDSRWVERHPHPGELSHIDSYIGDAADRPHTIQAWPAIYTGQKPETVNITGDLINGKLETAFDYAQDIPATLFDDVSTLCSLGAFRMAMTLPARSVNGWMISGFPAGKRGSVTPHEFAGIEPPEGYVRLRNVDHGPYGENEPIDYPKRLTAEHEKVDMFCNLVADTDIDVGFFGSQLPDHLGHMWAYKHWGTNEEPAAMFSDSRECRLGTQGALSLVETLLDRLDPDRFVVVSDHGFGETGESYHHSMHSTLLTDADGSAVDSILDVRDFITGLLDIDQVDEPYADRDHVEVTDAVEERLASWGYL